MAAQKYQYTDYNALQKDLGRGAADQSNVIDFMRYAAKNPNAISGSGMTQADVQRMLAGVDNNQKQQTARINPGQKSTYNVDYNANAAKDFMRKFNADGYNSNLPQNLPKYDDKGYMTSPGGGSPMLPGTATPGAMGTNLLNAQLKYDAQGRPIRNDYMSMTGRDGRILDQFSMANQLGADVNLNQDAYSQIKQNALGAGPSAQAQGLLQNQDLLRQNALDKTRTNSLAQAQQQQSMLASRGGITGAQRALLSRTAGRDALTAGQGVLNQDMQARNSILTADAARKDQMLSLLPGLDLQNANFQQQQRQYRDAAKTQDVSNAMKDVTGYNAYNAGAFGQALQEWGNGRVADAQAKASGSGGKGGK